MIVHGPSSTELQLMFFIVLKLVVNLNRGEWNHLARGTAFLLRNRGVHRYKSAFEQTMLESQLSYVVRDSLSCLDQVRKGLIFLVTAWSIHEAQRILFFMLPRMARSHFAKRLFSFSKIPTVSFKLASSAFSDPD